MSYHEATTPPAQELKSLDAPDANRDAARALKPTYVLYTSVLVALLQPFHFGWAMSQVNLSTFSVQDECNARPVAPGTCLMFPGHSKLEWTFVVNAWIVGGMIGSLGCGPFSQKFGRKMVLSANCIIMIVGAVVQMSASGLWVYVMGRLITGLASGTATGMIGGYINEVSPPHLRGKLVSWMQISINSGILLVVVAFFFGNTSSGWRYIAGFPIVLAVLFMGLSPFFMVESPAWLLSVGKRAQAEAEIARLFGHENVSVALSWMVDNESSSDIETPRLGSQDTEATQELAAPQATLSVLLSPMFRRQLILAIGVACAQQLSGINVVFYYSSDIFKNAGISDDRVGSLIVNIVNLLPTFVVGFLATRFGNRRLMLTSFICMAVAAVGMTVALLVDVNVLTILFTALYVAAFAFGAGPLTWIVTADVFPDSMRASAVSLCIGINWLCNLIVGVSYPYIADVLDDFAYVPFVALLVFFYFFALKLLPETSGKTNEEIQAEFNATRFNN